ncbi:MULTISPECIES: DNA polymerase III subunit delta' [Mediterranea]|uniref:DNA polymerase III subunit delta' n=1 Tax=Mediterranea TaxID=1926659 RepID=UPI000338DF0A|nr:MULTISPECIES: DNA polymerase III subunit delta' [Mediterranea]MCL1608483.1 DNA polymerase III subunit delta' [Mediterranea sp. ET5]MDM8123355.1 DNA polymerase III subunit delta' [Mediterranea massiliensis]MDM8199592.1 DNA polymerase III subunit delta' [Mediterranea massiliensis]CDD82127.1 putative DNA polymerase III delta subunit [Bacteroides sp. CAG:462]
MYFKDIIGQETVKQRLRLEVREGRVPHAQLFAGPEGTGALPLAIAYARFLLCTRRGEEDACGTCPSCVKLNKLAHPDLHFVFPVVKRKGGGDTVSDDYIREWRELAISTPYFGMNHWLDAMGAENQQAQIFVKESDELVRKLSLKSSEGGYKVVIIWLPEKMKVECANKLLKLLEEPPAQTVFLLVSEEPDRILPTILSRTQRINVPRLEDAEIAEALKARFGLQDTDAAETARLAEGSYLQALEIIHLSEDTQLFFGLFVSLMRLAYQRKVKEMREWSDTVAAMGRERQKDFLTYCQRMVRESFVSNFHRKEMNYMNREEENFTIRFAPFINERNVMGITDELAEAQTHIEQNVNPRMVFFDFALKMIVLLIQ